MGGGVLSGKMALFMFYWHSWFIRLSLLDVPLALCSYSIPSEKGKKDKCSILSINMKDNVRGLVNPEKKLDCLFSFFSFYYYVTYFQPPATKCCGVFIHFHLVYTEICSGIFM